MNVHTDWHSASNDLRKLVGDLSRLGLGLAVLDVEGGRQSHLFVDRCSRRSSNQSFSRNSRVRQVEEGKDGYNNQCDARGTEQRRLDGGTGLGCTQKWLEILLFETSSRGDLPRHTTSAFAPTMRRNEPFESITKVEDPFEERDIRNGRQED